MNFGEAIEKLKAGNFVYREGWNGKEQWLFYEDEFKLQAGYVKYDLQPFIMLRTTQATFIPWTVSQSDALAEDWVVQEPEIGGADPTDYIPGPDSVPKGR